jgi:hypothetical protein
MLPIFFRARSVTTRVVCYFALVAITLLSLNLAIERIHYRSDIIQKLPGKHYEGVRHKAESRTALALGKTAPELSFVVSLSLLRLDFQQNLRTWPTLATTQERAPPLTLS